TGSPEKSRTLQSTVVGILDLGEEEAKTITAISDNVAEEHLALVLSELIKAEPVVRSAFYPRIALEIALVRLGMFSRFKTINQAMQILQGLNPGVTEKHSHTLELTPGVLKQTSDPFTAHSNL